MDGKEPVSMLGIAPADLAEDPMESYTGAGRRTRREYLRHHLSDALGTLIPDPTGEEQTVSPVSSALANPLPAARTPSHDPSQTGAQWSRFRPLTLLAIGGAGEVWEAEQLSLSRIVAVKRIRQDLMRSALHSGDDPLVEERYFRQEAITASRLEHPNILPVYDLGMDGHGNPVLAMKRVVGTPWSVLLRDDLAKLAPDEFIAKHVPILIDVAQAVAFAHSRSVVHRDLKPSQVMVGEYGEVLLMDWGLAFSCVPGDLPERWRGNTAPIPPDGQMVSNPAGTPAFMAPEQTESGPANLGPWTDVFLLGGILYVLLTGRPPYVGDNAMEVCQTAAGGQWTPLAEAAPMRPMPEQLCALVVRSMNSRDRLARPTVQEFVFALKDFLAGSTRRRESIETGDAARALLSAGVREYPALAQVMALIDNARALWMGNPEVESLSQRAYRSYVELAVANNDLVLARVQADRLAHGPDRARLVALIETAERKQAERERQRRRAIGGLVLVGVLSVMGGAVAFWQKRRADQQVVKTGIAMEVARNSELDAKRARADAEREQYYAAIGYASASLREFNISKTRELLDRAPDRLRGWEWGYLANETHREAKRIMFPENILACAWHPDGSRAAVGGDAKMLVLQDIATGDSLRFTGHKDKIYHVAFDPAGRRIVSASKDKTAKVWDAQTGAVLADLVGHTHFVNTAEFHPRDNVVLTASSDGTCIIWNLDESTSRTLKVAGNVVAGAHFSPDGTKIVTASRDRTFKVWDYATGTTLKSVQTNHFRGLTDACFSPDQKLILTGSWDGDAKVYDAATYDEKGTIRLHTDAVYRVSFSPGGDRFATVSHDGTVGIWDSARLSLIYRISGHESSVWNAAWSPDGTRLMTGAVDALRLWNLGDFDPMPKAIAEAPMFEDAERVSLFYRDDASFTEIDNAWEPKSRSGGRTVEVGGKRYAVVHGATIFDPARRWRIDRNEPAALRNADTFELIRLLSNDRVRSASISDDGALVGLAYGNVAWLYRNGEWDSPTRLKTSMIARTIVVEPNGHRCAVVARDDGTAAGKSAIEIWSPGADKPSITIAGVFGEVSNLAFSPNGRNFAFSRSDDWTIRLWDLVTERETARASGHTNPIMSVNFHPDGSRLVSTSIDGSVRLWDAVYGRELLTLRTNTGEQFLAAQFSADGTRLLSPTSYGRFFTWTSPPPSGN